MKRSIPITRLYTRMCHVGRRHHQFGNCLFNDTIRSAEIIYPKMRWENRGSKMGRWLYRKNFWPHLVLTSNL